MDIIISGAGIGGLSAALCAVHHGHQVRVLERAAALREVGAGIQLPPNAMKVFAALGLEGALRARAFAPEALEARMGVSGRSIFRIALDAAAQKNWGAPYLHIHRADYIAVLKDALLAKAPHALMLEAEIIGYTQDAKSVTAQLADGRAISGDVLIGADGLHSKLQAQMQNGPNKPPRFTGNMAWRATVPVEKLSGDLPPPSACVWMGAGRHCVTYYLRGGALVNFVGVVEQKTGPHETAFDPSAEAWTRRGTAAQALADFDGWHPTLRAILGAAESHYCWALFDRPPLANWCDGRVALLGDAAHPMLPFMAQGAAMAVEDSWVLAQKLSQELNIAKALRAYQKARLPRTSAVQAAARGNAKTFHRHNRLTQLANYGPMWLAGRLAPALVRQRQDWLYAHNVVSD